MVKAFAMYVEDGGFESRASIFPIFSVEVFAVRKSTYFV